MSVIAVFDKYSSLVRSRMSVCSAVRTLDREAKSGVPNAVVVAKAAADVLDAQQRDAQHWFELCLSAIPDARARVYARLRWGLCMSCADVLADMDISETTSRRLRDKIIDAEPQMWYYLQGLSDVLSPPPPGRAAEANIVED